MKELEIVIVNYPEGKNLVAEIYFSSFHFATIFSNNKEFIVEFYCHPDKMAWEFPFHEVLHAIEIAKNKLLKKIWAKSNSTERVLPAQINEQAQEILERILNHPGKNIVYCELNRFGKIMDIYAPGLGGTRYTIDEEFIGFLEP